MISDCSYKLTTVRKMITSIHPLSFLCVLLLSSFPSATCYYAKQRLTFTTPIKSFPFACSIACMSLLFFILLLKMNDRLRKNQHPLTSCPAKFFCGLFFLSSIAMIILIAIQSISFMHNLNVATDNRTALISRYIAEVNYLLLTCLLLALSGYVIYHQATHNVQNHHAAPDHLLTLKSMQHSNTVWLIFIALIAVGGFFAFTVNAPSFIFEIAVYRSILWLSALSINLPKLIYLYNKHVKLIHYKGEQATLDIVKPQKSYFLSSLGLVISALGSGWGVGISHSYDLNGTDTYLGSAVMMMGLLMFISSGFLADRSITQIEALLHSASFEQSALPPFRHWTTQTQDSNYPNTMVEDGYYEQSESQSPNAS